MEKYQEIERSIIKKYRKEIWSRFTKAVKDYELINENDKIMVCISGGKDSFLLAKCIQELERHGKVKFEAHYVVMDPGYNDYNRQYIIFNKETGIYNLGEQAGYVYDYEFNYYLDEDGNILEIKNLKELKEKLINSLPNIYYINF